MFKHSTLLFVCCLGIFSLTAQTKKIAHKSHGGTAENFTFASSSNFGNHPGMYRTTISFVKLNDSTVIKNYTIALQKAIQSDTLINSYPFRDSTLTLETLKQYYPDVKFIGFNADDSASKTKKGELSGNWIVTLLLIGIASTAYTTRHKRA